MNAVGEAWEFRAVRRTRTLDRRRSWRGVDRNYPARTERSRGGSGATSVELASEEDGVRRFCLRVQGHWRHMAEKQPHERGPEAAETREEEMVFLRSFSDHLRDRLRKLALRKEQLQRPSSKL